MSEDNDQPEKVALKTFLEKHFSQTELHTLLFDLGIDPDNVPGAAKPEKAMEMVAYFAKRGQLRQLREKAQTARPFVPWAEEAQESPTGLTYAPDVLPEKAAVLPRSRMIFPPNPNFVGRHDELRLIARALKAGQNVAIRPTAVTGLGGLGKTQLAVEFAYRYGRYFPGGVFWLSFASPENVPAEIAACGGPAGLNLPYFDQLSQPDQVRRVQEEWAKPVPRLLIFDNCEAESLLDEWRPTQGGCCILLTSRKSTWSQAKVTPCPLPTLPRPKSRELLQAYGRSFTTAEAEAIAQAVGDLPLALQLAGRYLEELPRCTVQEYLAELAAVNLTAHESFQQEGRDFYTAHDLHVGRTFMISYARLIETETEKPGFSEKPGFLDAREVLAHMALLAPGEVVAFSLLEVLWPGQKKALDRACQRLADLGLLERLPEGERLHLLLGAFVRGQVGERQTELLTDMGQKMRAEANRRTLHNDPSQVRPWQAHLHYLTEQALPLQDGLAANWAWSLGSYLDSLGEYEAARRLYEQALAIRRQTLGESHPSTANTLHELGRLWQAQGAYAAARPLYEQALAIYRQTLGESHPSTAATLHQLGYLWQAQGGYEAARPLYEQALAIKRQTLGESHPSTATTLHALASLWQAQGAYEEARPLYEQALTIERQTLGESHPSTAATLHALASLWQAQGGYEAARPLYEQALAITRQTLGESHPNTATSLHDLGCLWEDQGDYAAARPLYKQSLAIYQEKLGENHPHTQIAQRSLARLERLLAPPPAPPET